MADVNIALNGRAYEINCDNGQEGRIVDLAAYIDQRLQQIARSGAAYNDAHLLVLTALVLADELFEVRESGSRTASKPLSRAETTPSVDDEAVAKLLDQLTKRIDGIAAKVQAA